MDGKRLLRSLRLENFLSYGKAIHLGLEPLNVFIGQNASGKSNLIQAIELLRAAPTNLSLPFIQGGGVEEWLYKGGTQAPIAGVEVVTDDSPNSEASSHYFESLSHSFYFASVGHNFSLISEGITPSSNDWRSLPPPDFSYYQYRNGNPVITVQHRTVTPDGDVVDEEWEEKSLTGIKPELSILSQRYDPEAYPSLSYLSDQYRSIKIYRHFNFDGSNSMRRAQQPDLPSDFLEEDGRNLSLILNDLQFRGVMPKIVEKLQSVYEDVEDIAIRVGGGTVQTFIRERGMSSPIPATRLSDGTLRYLCLLAILYHPTPPPLICLEDPEIGLHPDLISSLAEMLKDASLRTQLIVTTHSDLLVSKFSEEPGAVVVCERTPDGTTLERLEAGKLGSWLEEYSLGEVWLKGGLGGTRW